MVAQSEAASGVPVHVVDDTGALLLITEAMPTRDAPPAVEGVEGDVLQKILRGRELPRTGPTTVPALRSLPEPEITLVDAPEEPFDAPSGSALSAVDMTTLFGLNTASPAASPAAAPAAHGRHAR